MFKISSIYNDVPVTSLEKWNKIKRDDVKQGNTPDCRISESKNRSFPAGYGHFIKSGDRVRRQQIFPINRSSLPMFRHKLLINLPAPIPQACYSQNPVSQPVYTTVSNTAASTTAAIPVSNTSERVNNYAVTHSNGGFFSIDYAGSGKSASGMAGTFKSTSGWTDGKYYALMNGIAVGTIIRVTGYKW